MPTVPAYFPYRSEAARDTCFSYLDDLAAKTWPLASDDRHVPTPFGPTFVRVAGPPDAPALVLLPGATGTSLMWAPNIAALSRDFRVYAVDPMNDLGKSLCTQPIQTLADLLAWLDNLFDALRLDPGFHLIGMSYGGAVAANYALYRPDRLRRLVLVAPGSTILRPPLGFWLRVCRLCIDRRSGFASLFRWIFPDMVRRDPAWVDRVIEQTRMAFRYMERRKVPIPPVLSDAEWGKLKTDTLFLVGEHEMIYSAQAAVRRLNRVAPWIATAIIPNAGHDLSVSQPDLVNRRILEFLSQPSPVC
jgi:pimeloyl-ACP methyl ester carboxylesterase